MVFLVEVAADLEVVGVVEYVLLYDRAGSLLHLEALGKVLSLIHELGCETST